MRSACGRAHTHTQKQQYTLTHTYSYFFAASVENILAVRHQRHSVEIIFTARQQHAFYMNILCTPFEYMYKKKGIIKLSIVLQRQ